MLYYNLHHWLIFLLTVSGLSIVGVGWYQEYAMQKGIINRPNSHSSHKIVVPHGVGMILISLWCILFGLLWYTFRFSPLFICIFAPAFVIGYLGHRHDRHRLKFPARFILNIICAIFSAMAIIMMHYHIIIWIKCALIVLGIIWFTTLYDFMDGSDGIAATEGVFVFGVGGYLFYQSGGNGAVIMILLTWGLAALLLGFLGWNWPRASIFMGKSGTGFLGFIFAIVAIIGHMWFNIPLLIWLMLSGVFWFDTTLTLIRRILARKKFTEAHCSHAYQRLIQACWSRQNVLLSMICVNSMLAGLALWAYQEPKMLPVAFSISMIMLMLIYRLIEYIKPMFKTWYKI